MRRWQVANLGDGGDSVAHDPVAAADNHERQARPRTDDPGRARRSLATQRAAAVSGAPLTAMAWLRWDAINKATRHIDGRRILEVGAGQGSIGARLADRGDYTGLEPDVLSAAVARDRIGSRGVLIQGGIESLEDDYEADLICAFEVLEHIEDDESALSAWAGHLKAGGRLLISVPAHPERFGPVDELVGHHRRYTRDDLARLVVGSGLDLEEIRGYGAGLGHLLEWLRTRLAIRHGRNVEDVATPGSGRFRQPSRWQGYVTWAVGLLGRGVQRLLGTRVRGIGWIVSARKPAHVNAHDIPGEGH